MNVRYVKLTLLRDFDSAWGAKGRAGTEQYWKVLKIIGGDYLIERKGIRAFVTPDELHFQRKWCKATTMSPEMIFEVEGLESISLWQKLKNWFA